MLRKQPKYNSFAKYSSPILGVLLIFMNLVLGFSRHSNASIWDFEGFSISSVCSLILSIVIFVYGVYFFHINDNIEFKANEFFVKNKKESVKFKDVKSVHRSYIKSTIYTEKGKYHLVYYFINNWKEIEKQMVEELNFKMIKTTNIPLLLNSTVMGIIFIMTFFFLSKKNYKSHQKYVDMLPLKKIESVQIEGTIKKRGIVSLHNEGIDNKTPSITLIGGLIEYPGVYFHYDNYSLSDKIVNIKRPTNENKSRVDISENDKSENILRYEILKNTKVKLRIRPKDYDNMKQCMSNSNDPEKLKKPPNHNCYVKFYEFIVEDEIILKKNGLK